MSTVPIVDEITLISFMLADSTLGLTAIPSMIAVKSKKRFSIVTSIATSLDPSAFSTLN